MFGAAAAVALALAYAELTGAFPASRDDPAIQYDSRPTHDAVAALNAKIREGKVQLKFDGPSGYLRSVLEALEVPVESQMVVFSKTSLQMRIISPSNPRALYFSDSVAVGWVRGEPFVEAAVQDPEQGIIFYALNQTPAEKPQFERQNQCLQCHESLACLGIPGLLVRSSFPAPDGTPQRQLGDYLTDHRSPFSERWGGWFVTSKHGPANMGNTLAADPSSESLRRATNTATLEGVFDTSAYLSPYSDIAALMVFDHQMHMMNLLTRMGWNARLPDFDAAADASELVDYLLFVDEAPLTEKIEGTSGFAEKFAARGPRDRLGRSLRDLDLEHRLMRYPCSYMIYSPAFDALPPKAKDAIYRRIWQILSGQDKPQKYARLSPAVRRAIVEILRDTKAALPPYFK
jgi:hypothetical protein